MPLTRLDQMECPSCGAALEKSAQPGLFVCPYCGAKYKDDSAPTAPSMPFSTPAASKPAEPMPSRTSAQYTRLLMEAISGHTIPASALHTSVGCDQVRTCRQFSAAERTLHIPTSENCYLLYSSANFGCDNGFVLCDSGIYFCAEYGPDAGKPLHITWPQFSALPLSTRGNKLFFGENGFYIYDETGVVNLFTLLQKLH